MNKELIDHYKRGIELTKLDIRKIELEIHCKPLCDTIDQRNLIKSLEVLIQNLKGKINKLR